MDNAEIVQPVEPALVEEVVEASQPVEVQPQPMEPALVEEAPVVEASQPVEPEQSSCKTSQQVLCLVGEHFQTHSVCQDGMVGLAH